MSGRADGFRELVSSSTGGRGLRVRGGGGGGREGDEPSAATCHHTALLPLLLLCGPQTGGENLITVSLCDVHVCLQVDSEWCTCRGITFVNSHISVSGGPEKKNPSRTQTMWHIGVAACNQL